MSDPNLPGAARYEAIHQYEPVYDAPPWPGPGSPAKLLGVALGWLVLSTVGAGMLTLLIVGIASLLGWVAPGPADMGSVLVLPLQQGLMVLGAVRRGWRVGEDNLRAGLGWVPVRRRWLVSGLVGCTVLFWVAMAGLSLALPELHEFLARARPSLDLPRSGDLGYAVWLLGVVVIGAPVVEELFFRGWLWVGLRQRWGAWRTGAATGLLFLLVHGLGGEWRTLLVLAPIVFLLSLARELGGSVRASLAIHVANNGLAVAGLIARRLVGDG